MTHLKPLRSTISCLFLALMPSLVFGADLPAAPTGVIVAPQICTDRSTSLLILKDLEMCRSEKAANVTLRALNEKHEQLDEIRREREALLRERIDFLKEQNGELLRMNEAAVKMADQARPKWYEQAFTAGKYIGLGIIVGLAIGAVK